MRVRAPTPSLVLALLVAAWPTAPAPAQSAPAGPTRDDTIRIGVVVPGPGATEETGRAVLDGARAAVRAANREVGPDGRPFGLRVVTEEGLWGQGLAKVVALSFDDPVVAVVGGLTGRSAHLIQQVVTKARIPYVTPWASDFTLSRGMIPWFFQAVPDDRQQARAIAADLVDRGERTFLLVADTGYDSRHFARAVREAAGAAGLEVRELDPNSVLRTVPDRGPLPPRQRPDGGRDGGNGEAGRDQGSEAVVLATGPAVARQLLDRLARPGPPRPVYGSLRLAVPETAGVDAPGHAARSPAPLLVPMPDGAVGDPGTAAVAGLPAALGHDAVRSIIAAVRAVGSDPWAVRDALAVQSVPGRTGLVEFGPSGRRAAAVRLVPAGGATDGGSGAR